ncbi:unnamed protein product [Adineta steineri]|uniref:Cilia- and flagella-associated protein 300 n=1 Tax=Adineta steineri TaxID=433720 RepID=A0A819LHG7_9BILA|nr:unnamed protein product [Adineta steineri]CAF3961858.1 unnamed protein product [Adineta steineri]
MSENNVPTSEYRFQAIDKKFESIDGKQNRDPLIKWGMRGKIRANMYIFDQTFPEYNAKKFILDFFKDPNVLNTLKMFTKAGEWQLLGQPAHDVRIEQLNTNILSLEFFDRLFNNKIIREQGHIKKCIEEYKDEFIISDELRKVLIMDEFDSYDIFSDNDRKEFIFHLFKHFCLGGQVCQYEDDVQPYLDVTKSVYKEIISVQKDAESQTIQVVSPVFKIEALNENGKKFYPSRTAYEQDFAYIIIDPIKRHVIILSNFYEGPSFFE